MTTVGAHGDGVRSDARVTVSAGSGLDVNSSVEAMYGRAIREQAQKALQRFGNPAVHLAIEDSGALPFVLEARLEAAICEFLDIPLPDCETRLREPTRDRLRRTRLYVPGNMPKFIVNAGLYEADAVILDLEDSVPANEKQAARALVRQALRSVDFGSSERMVRINPGELGLRDARALARSGVDVFLLPKTESPSEVARVETLLAGLGCDALLLPILESANGLRQAYEIASASPRVIGIAIGIEDYLADIHAVKTEGGMESVWAHGQIVNSARAAGVSPFASVFSAIDEPAEMEAYARRMSQMGFDGVGCIHPGQVRPAHRGFAPSAKEVARAKAIVERFDQADRGAIQVDGMMVDAPIYRRAIRTLEMAGASDDL